IDLYHSGVHYFYPVTDSFPNDSVLKAQLSNYNTLIVSTYYTRSFGNNFDIPEGVKEFVNAIDFDGDLIFNLFGYPYALNVMGELNNTDALIVSYTNSDLHQRYAAQGIFGGSKFEGKLPVSIGEKYALASGVESTGGSRLKYSTPESVEMNFDTLLLINDIIDNAIREHATPGCQLLIARKGEVVWNKSYGYHTYRKRHAVDNNDIYDLASITKIASTIPSLMNLQDQGLFSVDNTLGEYFPELDTSAKADLQIKDILTHQSGLKAWIPFYYKTLEPMDTSQALINNNWTHTYPLKLGAGSYANRNIVYGDSIYDRMYSSNYPTKVADNLYLRSDFYDTIYTSIVKSPLGEKEYRYSDLGYYYFFRVVEDLTDTLFYPYNWYNFYAPLGAETMGFLPLNRFEKERIVPTENDLLFRRQLLQGYVHDPGAAMLGGVSGHAGLFSNANDLAKMMQMYLYHGNYGGKQYVDSATLAEFTSCQFPESENRRGLGFDRPMAEEDSGPACDEASELSFGHSGFTGTITWVDPKYDLVYVFLSNRIHPGQYNTKLISMNVRTDIQSLIYRSMEDYDRQVAVDSLDIQTD
ncbi:MAG: serine hydrolase, partial [Spirochaetales bacterium]|nr:serine hydrolase [Spirochaetales bacterium]